MALINCPECGKEISDTAKVCINCGYKLQRKKSNIIFPKRKIIAVSCIVLSILICICFGIFYGNYHMISVVGKSIDEAINLLDRRNVSYSVEYDYSFEYEKDTVYEQSVAPYSINLGREVILHVSLGKQYIIPEIIGKNIKELELALPHEIVYEYTDDIEKDIVISMSGNAGEIITSEEELLITVSEGIYKMVPDVKGMTREDAINVFEENNINYNILEMFNSEEAGIVYKYAPKKYGENDVVTLYVSSGEGIKLPDYNGSFVDTTEDTIRKKFEEMGINISISYDYGDVDECRLNGETKFLQTTQNVTGIFKSVEEVGDIEVVISKASISLLRTNTDINFVGGVDTAISFKNISDKQIAYVTFQMKYYDRMGNPAECSIRDTSIVNLEYTGPIDPGEVKNNILWEAVIYNSTTAAMKPISATVEFSDGSKQVITYDGTYYYWDGYYGGDLNN